MSTTHEAGWAHAAVSVRGPAWLREPGDVNQLVPDLWSQTARKVDGALEVGGVRLTDLVAEHGSPAYVLDEEDFRARARAFREVRARFAACDAQLVDSAKEKFGVVTPFGGPTSSGMLTLHCPPARVYADRKSVV